MQAACFLQDISTLPVWVQSITWQKYTWQQSRQSHRPLKKLQDIKQVSKHLFYFTTFFFVPPLRHDPQNSQSGKKSHWLLVSELLFLVNLDGFFSVMRGSREGKKSSNDRWKEPAESVKACFSFVLTLCCRISSAASVTLRTAAGRRSENDEDGSGKTRLDCIWKQNQSRRCRGQNLPAVLWRLN